MPRPKHRKSRPNKHKGPKVRHVDGNKVASYYDPGARPKPANYSKEAGTRSFLSHRNRGG